MFGSDWKFHHCGLIVRDARATCEHYRSLGFEVLDGPYETPPKSAENPMNSVVAWVRKEALTFEIMQPLEGRWVNKEFLQDFGEGISHICFVVRDLEAERRRMIEAGFPPVYGFTVPKGSFAYFDTRKSGNVMVELLQPAAASA